MNGNVSPLQKARFSYQPKLPAALRAGAAVKCIEGEKLQAFADVEKINAERRRFYDITRMTILVQ